MTYVTNELEGPFWKSERQLVETTGELGNQINLLVSWAQYSIKVDHFSVGSFSSLSLVVLLTATNI